VTKEVKEEEEKEVYFMEEVVEEADEGELLVLRGALSSHKGDKEDQREDLLHTGCTVHSQVCSLIIDGGSCANVASLSM